MSNNEHTPVAELKQQRDELLWTLEYVQGELSGWTPSLGLAEVLRVIDSAIGKTRGREEG